MAKIRLGKKDIKLGRDTAKYALGILRGGPLGALEVAAELQDKKQNFERKKKLKSTPTYSNYNIKSNSDKVNIWHSETTESGNVND